ncbi:PAS domain-containing protein [Emcibacter nanhaiensis]|nr:PAS domain-containing protein [Emcibacter nanhaiensis]
MYKSPVVAEDIKPDHLKELFIYWQKIRGNKPMPSRADFHPEELPAVLPHIVLFDVSDKKPYRYFTRLVGTETVRAMGFDFTGKYLDEIPSLSAVQERFDWISENGTPYYYQGKLVWSEKSYMDYCTLALPFSNDGKKVNILMYGTDYYLPDDHPERWYS